ncbi:MAG: transketolase C-terminal domain-containing protein [Planctomycetaceae bacterium]|jgi:transketolase
MSLPFTDPLLRLAAADQRVVLLTGDLPPGQLQPLADQLPGRCFDSGTADARLIQQAVSMALSGLRPIVLGAVAHLTTRCLDSIHSQICRHRARVTLVGLDAPPRGSDDSSVCRHDVALLRPLPNLAIACPADETEFTAVLRGSLSRTSATYIRLAGTAGTRIHSETAEIRPGRFIPVRPGTELCLLASGDVLVEALEAARLLESNGVEAAVVSCPSIKPLDEDWLDTNLHRFRLAVTLEDHGLLGGFGAAIAEWLVDCTTHRTPLWRCGTPEVFTGEILDANSRRASLEPMRLASQILKQLRRRRKLAA